MPHKTAPDGRWILSPLPDPKQMTVEGKIEYWISRFHWASPDIDDVREMLNYLGGTCFDFYRKTPWGEPFLDRTKAMEWICEHAEKPVHQ
jgi:hypothetical protein